MKYGLSETDISEILQSIASFSEISQAVVFGSRAKGNYKPGSDVDIAIKGVGISHRLISDLSFKLNEESLLPYYFDVIDYDKITEPKLTQHINRVGKVIYEKNIGKKDRP